MNKKFKATEMSEKEVNYVTDFFPMTEKRRWPDQATALREGVPAERLWSVTEGEEDGVWVYGPPHHSVNLLHIVETEEEHDHLTYYEEHFEKCERKTCCICGMGFSEWGNNPDPVKSSGTCCDSCNNTYVIPARLRSPMTARQRELLDEIFNRPTGDLDLKWRIKEEMEREDISAEQREELGDLFPLLWDYVNERSLSLRIHARPGNSLPAVLESINATVTTMEESPPSLEEAQKAVGGYVEIVKVGEAQLLVNEDGLPLKLPHNPAASEVAGQAICGNALLLKGEARWD